ncbi:MAG TPA: prolyl oligopeptidase family serine peptidase, partial [Phycisphaerae bacterium]
KLREVEYGPLSDPDFLKSISPIYKVDKIDTPLLIAHGLNDPRVPIGEALQIANELRRRHKPVDLLIFPDEGHGFVKEKNRLLYYDTAAAFFERYLHGSTGTE